MQTFETRRPKALSCALSFAALATMWSASGADAQSLDVIPIWSFVVEIHTCDISNGGSNDPVSIRIGRGTEVELNLGHNERNRNDVDSYELVGLLQSSTGVTVLDRPVLTKRGADMWCIDSVEILVNGALTPVYSWTGQLRLDSSGGLSNGFTLPSLRSGGGGATSRWMNAGAVPRLTTPPTRLNATFIWLYFETLQGHLNRFEPLNDDRFTWGGLDGVAYVTPSSATPSLLDVDFDLAFTAAQTINPTRDVDVDASYAVSCDVSGGYNVASVFSDCDYPGKAAAEELCTQQVTSFLPFFSRGLEQALDSVAALGGTCIAPTFAANGELRLR